MRRSEIGGEVVASRGMVDAKERWRRAGVNPSTGGLTRAELVGQMRAEGHGVTERQLRSWGVYGLLPKPQRVVPPGATDGVVRAVYPLWTIFYLDKLLRDVENGATIEELQVRAPEDMRYWAESGGAMAPPLDAPNQSYVRLTKEGGSDQPPLRPRLSRELRRAAWKHVEQIMTNTGRTPADIELTIRDPAGETIATVPIPPPPSLRRKRVSTPTLSDETHRP